MHDRDRPIAMPERSRGLGDDAAASRPAPAPRRRPTGELADPHGELAHRERASTIAMHGRHRGVVASDGADTLCSAGLGRGWPGDGAGCRVSRAVWSRRGQSRRVSGSRGIWGCWCVG